MQLTTINSDITNPFSEERMKIYYTFVYNYASKNTRAAYINDLKKFLFFLEKRFKGLSENQVEMAHIVSFKNYLLELKDKSNKKIGDKSINRILACLYSFYEHLISLKLVNANPVEKVKRFKVLKEGKTLDLSNEEVDKLINSPNQNQLSGLLHKAILVLFFTTGMRHRELTELKVSNLELNEGLLCLRYLAKGRKEMLTPLNELARNALGQYFEICQKLGINHAEDEYIFKPSKNPKGFKNKPLDSKSLYYIIKKYSKIAGIEKNITIHSARSTVIGDLLSQGISIDRVAEFVGHSDIRTTQQYNKRARKLENSLSFNLDISSENNMDN